MSVYRANNNLSAKINAKILEEIIERSLKIYRADSENTNRKEFVHLLMSLRSSKDVLELLDQTKKMISTKTINCKENNKFHQKLESLNFSGKPSEYYLEALEHFVDDKQGNQRV